MTDRKVYHHRITMPIPDDLRQWIKEAHYEDLVSAQQSISRQIRAIAVYSKDAACREAWRFVEKLVPGDEIYVGNKVPLNAYFGYLERVEVVRVDNEHKVLWICTTPNDGKGKAVGISYDMVPTYGFTFRRVRAQPAWSKSAQAIGPLRKAVTPVRKHPPEVV